MRQALIACAALLAALAAGVVPSGAAPFCIDTDLYAGVPDCSYDTWAACRKSLPGVGRYCYTNTAAGYIFDSRDPANPRVIGRKAWRAPWARH
jgi:hypothetical protein